VERIATSLPGVWELRPKVFRDFRGFFLESYHHEKFKTVGITDVFVQDNHSASTKNTLRGFHYQLHRPQAKLCRVVQGEVLDIAVDIRLGSPTFGKWTSVVLSDREQNLIYIPAGFAHGFLALTDSAQFLYKCTDYYEPSDEHGIAWNDPDIGVAWGITYPLLSPKDANYPTLATAPRECLPHYEGR
jgi:dTDP-4-dehydrorhamnose 3,5-epimerase